MRFFRSLMICTTVVLVTGCASNVTFYKEIESNSKSVSSAGEAVRVYVDAFGSIYPEDEEIVSFGNNVVDSGGLYDQFS